MDQAKIFSDFKKAGVLDPCKHDSLKTEETCAGGHMEDIDEREIFDKNAVVRLNTMLNAAKKA
jgi:hypothetical protein